MHHAARGEGRIAQGPSNPKVADQGRAVLSDQDVARLHISVDDADRVGGCQRRCHLRTYLSCFVRLQRSTFVEHGSKRDRGKRIA